MSERDPYYGIKAVSNSFLTQYQNGMQPQKDSPAFKIGRGVHELIMEPHKFVSSDYSGKERVLMMAMADKVHAGIGFEWQGIYELDYLFVKDGMKAKSKVDVTQQHTVIDFKTTRLVSLSDFKASVFKWKYYRQAAFYLDIPAIKEAGIDEFIIIAVSKVKPHPVHLVRLHRDGDSVVRGRAEIKHLMGKIVRDPATQYLKADDAWLNKCVEQGLANIEKLSI